VCGLAPPPQTPKPQSPIPKAKNIDILKYYL